MLAIIAGLQHFRHYVVGATVILRTDHYSLKWLRIFKRPERILARWIETLAEFDYCPAQTRPFTFQCGLFVPALL